mmetsp:Transcript_3557/g.10969  ORF Transcript_3557/g.10969 Transcript_3557/m.10969 type:complete len:262 (+) Transcript_3557:1320-2105(+)
MHGAPGAERRRQIHSHLDAHRAVWAVRRQRIRGGQVDPDANARDIRHDRRVPAARCVLAGAHDSRASAALCATQGRPQAARARVGKDCDPRCQAERARGQAGQAAVRRRAASAVHRDQFPRQPERGVPGRAHDRRGPGDARARARAGPAREAAAMHRADDAPHVGGGEAVGPHRDYGPREPQDAWDGLAAQAQVQRGLQADLGGGERSGRGHLCAQRDPWRGQGVAGEPAGCVRGGHGRGGPPRGRVVTDAQLGSASGRHL